MRRLSLQSRIAFSYIITTVILMYILCTVILTVFHIHTTRYSEEIVEATLDYYMQGITWVNGEIHYQEDPDHTGVKAGIRDKRTTYVEIVSLSGVPVYLSPNLQGYSLPDTGEDFELNGETVRLTEVPLVLSGNQEGTFRLGIAVGDAETLMAILFRVCATGCLIIFIILFAISRGIAKKSIKPIRQIIQISNTITHNNLSARIPLPSRKDELYELSDTINQLLDRIEYAMEREKSFTSYASHEFRTPLSVLKGTMEVLIRRPRSEEEYKERISACIREVDKLNEMVEQLLILTRYEEGKRSLQYDYYSIEDLIHSGISLFSETILKKKIEIVTGFATESDRVYTDEYSLTIILNNLLSNAVKYCNEGGKISVQCYREEEQMVVEIQNTGTGIPKDELEHIFEKFYRSYTSETPDTKGFGLGLPIVKRFCSLLNMEIGITSEVNQLTTAKLIIPLQ